MSLSSLERGLWETYIKDNWRAFNDRMWSSRDDLLREQLHQEAEIYNILLSLQGIHIPIVYGLFMEEHFHVLIMKYAGKTLTSFEGLTVVQR